MGLTERHWFENEDVPENYEWNLEDAVYNSHTNKQKADMVEVVRCKYCKHYKDGFCYNPNTYDNEKTRGNTVPDWFCADGKKR